MWQILVAAAVGGSGLVARRLLNRGDHDSTPDAVPEMTRQRVRVSKSAVTELSIPKSLAESSDSTPEKRGLVTGEDPIFRFSSKGSSGRCGVQSGCRKKGKSKANAEGAKKGFEVHRLERRFSFCLKKRKTGKNASIKCGPRCSPESSLFSWGLGVGIMYMVSAGKSEISKLNTTVDETAKVVQELEAEVYKRKSSSNMQSSISVDEVNANAKKTDASYIQPLCIKSRTRIIAPSITEDSVFTATDDGECASSVLTEEPSPEMMEMDQMEAELESELLKLPGCLTEDCGLSSMMWSAAKETEVLAEGYNKAGGQISESHRLNGVLPSELDQKLCHVLIERQESQIVELESELQVSQSKLREKEAELQALKDCVRRLSEFSISSVPDIEAEVEVEGYPGQEWTNDSSKSSVGTKRGIGSVHAR